MYKSICIIFFLLFCFSNSMGFLLNSLGLRRSWMEKSNLLAAPLKSKFPYLHLEEYPEDDYSHIYGIDNPSHKMTKLHEISAKRIESVKESKTEIDKTCGHDPSFRISSESLLKEIEEFDIEYGKPKNLFDTIVNTPVGQMSIAAEFKRASPSKGILNAQANATTQCLQYAQMGAKLISVLTEFNYFKGTLNDMKAVRLATQAKLGPDSRPLILRKDFLFDRYQILEARANGADTVLLIVAVLGVNQLKDLINFSRKLGIEPLVEVNTEKEMEIALKCGAKAIGINNRNLHTFQLDMNTTPRVIQVIRNHNKVLGKDICVAALSGISTANEVREFQRHGVQCCLVGETLMKAPNPKDKIRELFFSPESHQSPNRLPKKIVKVCGMKEPCIVKESLEKGTNLIGLIFVPSSKRKIHSIYDAKQIVEIVQRYGERSSQLSEFSRLLVNNDTSDWFNRCADLLNEVTLRRPLAIGVFQDQPSEEINKIVSETSLDLIQLHGSESPAFISSIDAPCIKVIQIPMNDNLDLQQRKELIESINSQAESYKGKAVGILLDTIGGGTGKSFDWTILKALNFPFFLAGGINQNNIKDLIAKTVNSNLIGIDLNSGVELEPGKKSIDKIEALIRTFKELGTIY